MRARRLPVGIVRLTCLAGVASLAGLSGMIDPAAVRLAAAQQSTESSKSDDRRTPAPVTLSGCVERGPAPNEVTIEDSANGKYRVSGSRINRYVGQRVEVVGNLDTGRLKVRGGLYPTPNSAGGAHGNDPVKRAMAGQPGGPASGTGGVELPELRVRSVKTLSGGCR